jgi:hypothetical protein
LGFVWCSFSSSPEFDPSSAFAGEVDSLRFSNRPKREVPQIIVFTLSTWVPLPTVCWIHTVENLYFGTFWFHWPWNLSTAPSPGNSDLQYYLIDVLQSTVKSVRQLFLHLEGHLTQNTGGY